MTDNALHTGAARGKPCGSFLCLLSALAFGLLFVRPIRASWAVALLAAILAAQLTLRAPGGAPDFPAPTRKTRLTALAVSGVTGLYGAAVWLLTIFKSSARTPGKLLLAAAATLVCIPLSYFCVCRLVQLLSAAPAPAVRSDRAEARITAKERLFLLTVAFAAITVCSLNSPLYCFNDWVDINCFFTVGKSMLFGKIPYRDLYEQKGPLLYALYALAYPVSHRGFLGVWLLEIAAFYAFLLLSYRTFLLFCPRRSIVLIPLEAVLVCTANAFMKGGSAEELCLPLVMVAMYLGLRSLRGERPLSGRDCLAIGLSSGAVLWIKFTLLGFYPGFILVPAVRLLREKKGGTLLRQLLLIFAGVVLATLPVAAYFGWNHALGDLWQVYLYDNLFVYSKAEIHGPLAAVGNLAWGVGTLLLYNDAVLFLTAAALLCCLLCRKRELFWHILLCFVGAFVVIYVGGRHFRYYSEILGVFVPLGLIALWEGLERLGADRLTFPAGKRLAPVLACLLFLAGLFGTKNTFMLRYDRDTQPLRVFAAITDETPGATLLNYGSLDLGLYTASGIVPNCRYFCSLNMPLPEIEEGLRGYLDDGVTDYVVCREEPLTHPNYTLVSAVDYKLSEKEFADCTYYLYRRNW